MSMFDFMASLSELYDRRMAPVSRSFQLTAKELSILLFLANNPAYDTAKEIVEKRHLTKSHVSVSLRHLEELGYIRKEHRNGDHRTDHLTLCSSADDIIREGRKAQTAFLSDMTAGFSAVDTERFQTYIDRMYENILAALHQ